MMFMSLCQDDPCKMVLPRLFSLQAGSRSVLLTCTTITSTTPCVETMNVDQNIDYVKTVRASHLKNLMGANGALVFVGKCKII